MIVKEIKCKSLLNKSKLADYCINPYLGCGHGCVYCYADSITRRFSSHKEAWGSFVDVKVNAPEILEKEVLKKRVGTVFISSLTDPYQPLEKKYGLTRKILEILLKKQFPVCIQTKSSLVVRDVDLLKKFKDCEVGFTITTLDEKIRKIFEPFSSSVDEKLEALKIIKENGIKTYVFLGPFLPFLSDNNLEEYFQKISGLADEIYVDKLNLKLGVWEKIEKVLEQNYPELVKKWKSILLERNDYYEEIRQRIKEMAKRNNLKCNFCY